VHVTTFEVVGDLDEGALAAAICDVDRTHSTIAPLACGDDLPIGGALDCAHRIAALQVLAAVEDASELAASAAIRPSSGGPACLITVAPCRTFAATWGISLVTRAANIDAWSRRVLMQDFSEAYSFHVRANHDRPIGAELAKSPALDRRLSHPFQHVLRQLSATQMTSGSSSGTDDAARIKYRLALEADVILFARRQKVTITAVLLAVLAKGLERALGRDDVSVAVPVSQRDKPGSSRVVGALDATAVVRLGASAGGLAERSRTAQDRLLEAMQSGPVGAEAHACNAELRRHLHTRSTLELAGTRSQPISDSPPPSALPIVLEAWPSSTGRPWQLRLVIDRQMVGQAVGDVIRDTVTAQFAHASEHDAT
jgi:hypothetical protein